MNLKSAFLKFVAIQKKARAEIIKRYIEDQLDDHPGGYTEFESAIIDDDFELPDNISGSDLISWYNRQIKNLNPYIYACECKIIRNLSRAASLHSDKAGLIRSKLLFQHYDRKNCALAAAATASKAAWLAFSGVK